MSLQKKIQIRAKRRALKIRSRIREVSSLPRVSVFRSLKHIYAQIIDDTTQRTLVSCSSLDMNKVSGDKKTVAHSVGLELATRAHKNGIERVVFDRGGFLYHGRVKALADGLREGGLKI